LPDQPDNREARCLDRLKSRKKRGGDHSSVKKKARLKREWSRQGEKRSFASFKKKEVWKVHSGRASLGGKWRGERQTSRKKEGRGENQKNFPRGGVKSQKKVPRAIIDTGQNPIKKTVPNQKKEGRKPA